MLADDGVGAGTRRAASRCTDDRRPARSSLVDRGSCTFKTKALNVQNAGGIGVILANNVASTAPPGLGDDATITTRDHDPVAVGHCRPTATLLKADIAAGTVTATMHRTVGVELDGTLDCERRSRTSSATTSTTG